MQFFYTHISPKAIELVNQTLKSGFINQGPRVDELEHKLEELGYQYPVTVNSCTSALHLALEILEVEGKEVILPAQTFIATGLAVLMARGKPVFCDINIDFNAAYDSIKNKITKNTACIIIVNWAGNECDKRIFDLDIPVVHDLAHSFGYISPAHLSCYSFQAIKHVTAGDGGLLCCSYEADYRLARKLRWFGINKDTLTRNELGERISNIDLLGYKYNMNDIDASLVLGNLTDFDERLKRRKEIYRTYIQNISSDLYIIRHTTNSQHWLCNCLVENRSSFIKKMKSHNIPVSVVDRRIDTHPIFDQDNFLPVQLYIDETQIHLPLHEALTDEDVDHIITTINTGW